MPDTEKKKVKISDIPLPVLDLICFISFVLTNSDLANDLDSDQDL